MSHRELLVLDDKLKARAPHGSEYAASDLSDGERVAFYLIGEVLIAPDNAIVIIDEPEIHLHHAIQARLWDEIEGARPDCLLVYITHDLDFATSRKMATKIIARSFDGTAWKWDLVPNASPLPESVLLEVLGSRRTTVFVEGDADSIDLTLLSLVFPEYLIIPRGGCEKVIETTKGLRESSGHHNLKPFGLIDRDYRTNKELSCLTKHGVYAAEVSEIENLLCVDEVLELVAAHLRLDVAATVQRVHEFVLGQLEREIEQQAINRTQKELTFRLAGFGVKARSKTELQNLMAAFTSAIDVDEIYAENQKLFRKVVDTADFPQALKLYNRKSLASRISAVFDLRDGGYPELVIRLLKDPRGGKMAAALRKYLPSFASADGVSDG